MPENEFTIPTDRTVRDNAFRENVAMIVKQDPSFKDYIANIVREEVEKMEAEYEAKLEEEDMGDAFIADAADNYQEALSNFEARWLEKVMQETKYNQSKAAEKMGMSRGTLRQKLREHFGSLYFRDTDA